MHSQWVVACTHNVLSNWSSQVLSLRCDNFCLNKHGIYIKASMKSLCWICHIASFLKLHGHTFISISTSFKNLIMSLFPPGALLGKVKSVWAGYNTHKYCELEWLGAQICICGAAPSNLNLRLCRCSDTTTHHLWPIVALWRQRNISEMDSRDS